MCNFSFEIVEPSSLKYLRDMQTDELKGPAQDSTEEGIVTYNADFVKISKESETAGYACIGTYGFYKDIVLEYYLMSKFRISANEIIEQLARNHKCKQWLVNTQDFFAFPTMLDLHLEYEIDAYKFTADEPDGLDFEFGNDVTLEITKQGEIPEVYQLISQDGFYTGGSIETLIPSIKVEELYSLRIDHKLIGVGFISILSRTPAYADIAMIIDEMQRNRGWGTFLVKTLINKCIGMGIIPTAVCDVNNLSSRKTLQRSGFHLNGCLLLAQFKS